MKQWGSALFPLSILFVLAGLTFWLRFASELPDPGRDGRYRHDPDFIIGSAVLDKIDPTGRLLYTVKADEVRHFPDDETSDLTRPNVVYSPFKRPPMTMNADFGRISENGDVVDLSGNVKIVRAASGKDEALTATTSQLTVLTNEEKAYTRAPAQIVQGKSWITGVGMRLDQRAQTYVIEAQARAVLESKKQK